MQSGPLGSLGQREALCKRALVEREAMRKGRKEKEGKRRKEGKGRKEEGKRSKEEEERTKPRGARSLTQRSFVSQEQTHTHTLGDTRRQARTDQRVFAHG